MHDHSALPEWAIVVNVVANLTIVGGYALVPFTVLARLPLTMFVRVSGVLFFGTCAVTHAVMALGDTGHWLMVVNHVAQAGAVWCFVLGFARLLREAERKRGARKRRPGGTKQPAGGEVG